ncbi:MAG: uroporphyrinogen-III C-methyltransferase [Gammaproteobacteria bacterium]|nr:uroporphyrinogen-III C-methyltransferase [Gammaproteobacteria bacterium]MCP5200477.1 uroporphyrinogen-III C-methyltransferase [Gammaproteobacteria bacterium]
MNDTTPATDQPAAEAAAEDVVDTTAPAAPPRQSRAPLFVLLLALLLVAGAGYYWVTQIFPASERGQDTRLADLAAAQTALAARVDAADAAAAAASADAAAVDGRLGELDGRQDELAESIKALFTRDAEVSLDWVLAEAEYLVFAATQRLALEQDVATATAALRAADERLAAAKHPDLTALRKQLTSDIAALEAVAQPDIEGLALWLAEAQRRADDLPTRPIAALDTGFRASTGQAVDEAGWGGMARALWSDLVSLVQVEDGEMSDSVLFDPKLRFLLRQNLRLELASARHAALRRDDDNFRASTAQVVHLLETYYDTDDGAVQGMLKHLQGVAGLELAPALPDISGSLDAVRRERERLGDNAVAQGQP